MDVAGNGIVESILIDSDGELVSIEYRSTNAYLSRELDELFRSGNWNPRILKYRDSSNFSTIRKLVQGDFPINDNASSDDLLVLFAAGGRRIRHGAELRDSRRAEYQAHVGTARSLPAQSPGKQWA